MKLRKEKNKNIELVKKFVNYSELKRADWPREIKLAKTLLENSGDFFVKAYLSFKLNSLAWFLTEDGKKYVFEEKLRLSLNFKPTETVILSNEKVGESLSLPKKPRNLKEFLNYGKSKD